VEAQGTTECEPPVTSTPRRIIHPRVSGERSVAHTDWDAIAARSVTVGPPGSSEG
jgi:hypothetical protein